MKDREIRRELDILLQERHASDPSTVIRHELGLCGNARRIDVAVLNDELHGYEIKSDSDTLSRLAGQARLYGQVLDRATLVTTPGHLGKALALLPEWWGITAARPKEPDGIDFETVREPELNTGHDAFMLARMLWRSEALEELNRRRLGRGLSKSARYYAYIRMAQSISVEELRHTVREKIKARGTA